MDMKPGWSKSAQNYMRANLGPTMTTEQKALAWDELLDAFKRVLSDPAATPEKIDAAKKQIELMEQVARLVQK